MKIKHAIMLLAALLTYLSAAELPAQELRSIKVMDGVKAFYMADFAGAREILQDALLNSRLSDDDLFAAHVYIAFSYLREEIEPETARLYMVNAIRSAPGVQLDVGKIPPDLYQHYLAVRQSIIGSLSLHTTPEDAAAVLVDPVRNRALNIQTPGIFENLLEGSYNLLVSRNGFKSYSAVINLAAGESKNLEVVLLKKRGTFISKNWRYGAGAVAATAVVAAILSGGKKSPPPAVSDLPTPPARPKHQ